MDDLEVGEFVMTESARLLTVTEQLLKLTARTRAEAMTMEMIIDHLGDHATALKRLLLSAKKSAGVD